MTRRQAIPLATRRAVLDGSPCAYCGDESPIAIDHVLPVSRGGSNDLENLVPACTRCNTNKLDFTPEEWRAWREEVGLPWPPESRRVALLRIFEEQSAETGIPVQELMDGFYAAVRRDVVRLRVEVA